MARRRESYLLILSEREALAWVVREQRMAFPPGREQTARRLSIDDRLFLYTTRGCFHNPTKDRGRIAGMARVATSVMDLDEPVTLAGRSFSTGCEIEIEGLAPLRTGVEFAPLVERLEVFPDPASWSVRMRRPFLSLPVADAQLIERLLRPRLRPLAEVIPDYLAAARHRI